MERLTYQLQACWGANEDDFRFISQLSRMVDLLLVSDLLREHGCARTRIVLMPDGVHPKDYTIVFTSEE